MSRLSCLVMFLAATLFNTAALATPSGAIIRMTMNSTVGVLLDELPAGSAREQAATNALAKGSDFWIARARHQIRLMNYRLVFRGQFYSSDWSNNPHARGPLPLPPVSVW